MCGGAVVIVLRFPGLPGTAALIPGGDPRVLVRVLLVGFGWRDMGEARRINVRF